MLELKPKLTRHFDVVRRIAGARYQNAMSIAAMESSIRLAWKKLQPHVKEDSRSQSKAFTLLSICLVHAWKKGKTSPATQLPDKFFETKAKLRYNIDTCPYKGQPFTRCTTCECRAEYLEKRGKFWTRHENVHWPITTLGPAEECNTGR